MIIQLMMAPLWALVYLLINLFPVIESFPTSFGVVTDIIGYGCAIVGTDFFLAIFRECNILVDCSINLGNS